jgi:glycosyltransferase involved in cell wall biosynthesis
LISPLRILVAQIGARRHYAVPSGLAQEGCLERLETSLCAHHPLIKSASVVPVRFQPKGLQRLSERIVYGVPEDRIHSSLRHEWTVWCTRDARSEDERYRQYCRRNSRFAANVASCEFGHANTVYGFNAACIELFQVARDRGLFCVLDQTMAPLRYVEAILAEERANWPGWESHIVSSNAWLPLAEREESEMNCADSIICGSDFVVDAIATINGPAERCAVVPYTDINAATPKNKRPQTSRPLRVLFAGTVCLRKGIQYLWQTAGKLDPSRFEIRAVGPIAISTKGEVLLRQRMALLGPCTRAEMVEHYRWADVLVLPTLAEGSANVTYEALARGVSVITTPNAGSTVRDGVDGYLVPIRDPEAIRESLFKVSNQLVSNLTCAANQYDEPEINRDYGKRLVNAIWSKVGSRATTELSSQPA